MRKGINVRVQGKNNRGHALYGLNQSVFSELSFGKGAGEKGLMGDVQYIIDIIFHSFFYQIIHPFFQPSLQSF